jgi:diguanylate cyclase (GGDEF)-like protein
MVLIDHLTPLFTYLHVSIFTGGSANTFQLVNSQFTCACDIYLLFLAIIKVKKSLNLSSSMTLTGILLLVVADFHSFFVINDSQYFSSWSNSLWLFAVIFLTFGLNSPTKHVNIAPQRFLQFNISILVLTILEMVVLALQKAISARTMIPLLIIITISCISFLDVISSHVIALKMRENSLKDSLTQLPNRKAFFAALHNLWGKEFVLAMIDLNKFKEINDTYGHFIGDKVLVLVAQRLEKFLPMDSTLARLGGDEFAFIAPIAPQEALEVLHLMVNAFSIPFSTGEASYEVGLSLGYTHFTEENFLDPALTPTVAIQRADQAMYIAKNSGITISNWRNETFISPFNH